VEEEQRAPIFRNGGRPDCDAAHLEFPHAR
jgi:hypothetical protein